MRTLDYGIFFTYLAGIFLLGLSFSRRKQSAADFLVAGRSMKWIAVGSSILATAFSAINFTAFSEEVFAHGLYVIMSVPVFALVAYPVTRIVIPFYHKMQPVSAYEYLEKRFDARVRKLASGIFIIWRIFWMSVALYATALFISAVTGINLRKLIVLAGVMTTAYALAGGMRAVMWTNMAQALVLFVSLVVSVIVSAHALNGFSAVFARATQGGLLKPFYPFDPQILSLNPTIRITMWSAVIGTFVAFLARYSADQMVVQRYFTAKTEADARRGFGLNVAISIISRLCLAFLGLAIFSYVATIDPAGGSGIKAMTHIGNFVASLPFGACGLLVAGLFASTMSNVDAGIHSCCTAFVTDFLPRTHQEETSTPTNLVTERVLMISIAIIVTTTACFVWRLGSVFEIANKIVNAIGSPLLALLLAALYGRSLTASGMFYGGMTGTVASICISLFAKNIALHYYAVANLLATLLFCWIFSILLPTKKSVPSPKPNEIL